MSNRVPAYLYHSDHEPTIFETEEALDAALDDGWQDHPDKCAPKASDSLPAEIAGLDIDALKVFAKDRWPSMVIHPAIKLETLQAKVTEAMQAQA